MNGDVETGVTIMRVVAALDAGPMLACRVRPIGADETSEQVERDLAQLGAALLIETLEALEAGTAVETPQDDTRASYAPRLTKEEGLLDWSLSAQALHNRVRGLRPWPQAYTFLGDERLVIASGRPAGISHDREPGTVLLARGAMVVAAGAGTSFEVLAIQPEGRRLMGARDFLAGHAIAPGASLGGPAR
jgi:methionyl-tRNA formyltransferase